MPKFVWEDVLRAFWLVGKKQPLGRRDLAYSLDLGEGTARSIVSFLEKKGLVKKIRGGCLLSENGKGVFEKLSSKVSSVRQLPPLFSTMDRPSFCLQCVLNETPSVKKSIEARDCAVKAGSDGVLSLSFSNKRFLFAGTKDAVSQKDSKIISEYFKPNDGQVFVLSFAKKPLGRERGAWAAFLNMAQK
jgi:predicted transcriptional regulator